MQKFVGKKLSNEKQALRAKHFVYEVYAHELNWLPQPGNPSNWIVAQDEQGHYFTDKFDTVAVWFGVCAGDEMVAVGRFIEPLDNKLEVELYQEIPEFLRKKQEKRVEVNRLAVLRKYTNSPALLILLQTIYKYLLYSSIDFIVTGVPKATIDFAKKIGLKNLDPPLHFFYTKGESTGATVMYRDCRNKENLKKQISQLNMDAVKVFKFFVKHV
jgi:hypothetical protein